jgi:flagellin
MTLNTNISSMNANAALTNVGNSMYSSIEKLSTGLRINKAADDPSGLAIADKLRTQISSTKQSLQNANLSISLLQIADRAMAEQSNILDIVKQKLIQGSTSSTSDEGRKIISSAIGALLNQFDEIAIQTRFQDKYLLQKNETDTNKTDKIVFVLGEFAHNTAEARDGIQANTQGIAKDGTLTLATLKTSSLSENGISIDDMKEYIDIMDTALDELNTFRSDYGSVQQQVESTARNLLSQQTSMSNAESAIRDVDYAQESSSFRQSTIMYEAGSFALTQANLAKDYILKMLT